MEEKITAWVARDNSYMLMKDKIIFVLYVGCKEMKVSDALRRVVTIRDSFKTSFDESSQLFVLPNSDMHPMKFQLECLNPKYLTPEEQKRLSDSLDKFLKNMNEYETAAKENKTRRNP